jgi:hypothetical protein
MFSNLNKNSQITFGFLLQLTGILWLRQKKGENFINMCNPCSILQLMEV